MNKICIDLEEFKIDYCDNLLTISELSKKYAVCPSVISKIVKDNKLIRDSHLVKSKSAIKAKNVFFTSIKNEVKYSDLHQYYILEDHSYEETQNHFNITGWILDKLLHEYKLKKDRKISAIRGLDTKYKNAGSREQYYENQKQSTIKTKIKKYGSLENYRSQLSSKCYLAWKDLSEEQKKLRISTTMSHGGGWNKDTIKETLLDKYGVDNAYKLATNYQTNSKVNQHFADKLEENGIEYRREQRYGNMRYDFQIDNILVEINPWPFHNLTYCLISEGLMTDANYHKQKTEVAEQSNLRCIHVFDWDDEDKIIRLLLPQEKVFARKCEVKEVDDKTAKDFINENHLQGYARDSIRIGLFENSSLISIMTFGKPRYNRNYEYELIRYCSSKNIIGGAEKLFTYFIRTYTPNSIISYCDLSKFSGQTYTKLGFTLKSKSKAARHWFNIKTGKHITDNLLRQQGFDRLLGKEYGYFGKGTDNDSLMRQFDFVEIYDCGQATYVWEKEG